MDFSYSGYGAGEQEEEEKHHHHHHHHPHFFNKPPAEEGGLYFEGERYPPPQPHAQQGYGPDYAPFPQAVPYPPISPDYAPLPVQVPYPPISYVHHESTGPYTHHEPTGSSHHGHTRPTYTHPASSGSYIHSDYSEEKQDSHTGPLLPQGQLVRVFCKGNSAFNLALERDTVVMKPASSEDEAQQWIRDSTYGMRIKDNYGYPAFALVNKKTNKMLKHAKEKGQQVLLVDYKPDMRDDDILWTESQDFGEGFKTVRCASDTLLNLTVFEGGKKIRNGSALVLDTWHKADHQLWKLFSL